MHPALEDILAKINAGAEKSVRDLVSETAADVRKAISVPVQHRGRTVIRSKPGEPPRKETTSYLRSWQEQVTVQGNRVEGSVYTDDQRAEWFTQGTSRMAPRPHGEASFDRAASIALSKVSDALNE